LYGASRSGLESVDDEDFLRLRVQVATWELRAVLMQSWKQRAKHGTH
jgi:hypothetical protein